MSRAVLVAVGLAVALPSVASAFCGFFVSGADQKLYNSASHVVLMRKGNHTVMTMSNSYKGPPQDFAMVVPVPVVHTATTRRAVGGPGVSREENFKDLAGAERGAIKLVEVVKTPVPSLGLPGAGHKAPAK